MPQLAATFAPVRPILGAAVLALLTATTARADVTVTQDSTIDALIMTMHSHVTDRTAGDKQRRDSDMKLDGPLSFLAGNPHSADILRLDRELEWRLDLDKKRYTETQFPTPEQRAAAQQKMQVLMEKAKQCPTPVQAKDPTEGCEKSEPKFDARKTDEVATIAGHPTKKTLLTMTYSCRNVKTNDVCDFTVANELWISQDAVPGYDERRAFAVEHAKKLGLDELTGPMMGQMRTMMGPYLDQLKQVAAKAGDLKGTPLRTTLSVSIGGPQCAAAKSAPAGTAGGSGATLGDASDAARDAATQSAEGSANSAARSAVDNSVSNSPAGRALSAATGAFGAKLVGGLFGKKADPKPADAATSTANASAAPATTHSLLSFTTEVKSISTDAIPADQFELPPGFQKNVPKPGKDRDEEFTCPKTGG